MKYSELADRYASALYDLAQTPQARDKDLSALKAVSQALNGTEDLVKYVMSPLIAPADKEAAIKVALAGTDIPEHCVSTILVMAQKGRLGFLAEVAAAYSSKMDKDSNILRGEVLSAKEISAKQIEIYESKISSLSGKKVVLQFQEDKNLIGGVVVKVGSHTYDDSLETHVNNIKIELNRRLH